MSSWLPFSLPSSIQKRFLSYALSSTGLFDESAIDLDKWNFTWGRRNVIELKDVALNTVGISQKCQLPPYLHLESAKILTLKLMVPADIHRSSIECNVDGIEIVVSYEQEQAKEHEDERSSTGSQSPSHRKIHRRIGTDGRRRKARMEDGEQIPTVQDLARSFLLEEPASERRQLEASVAQTAALEESYTSQSSDGAELGTGTALGVPAFLAGFLKGILDRIVVSVKNVNVKMRLRIPAHDGALSDLSFRLSFGSVRFWTTTETNEKEPVSAKTTRNLEVRDVVLDVQIPDAQFSSGSQSNAPSSPQRARSMGMEDSQVRTTNASIDHSQFSVSTPLARAQTSVYAPSQVSVSHSLDQSQSSEAMPPSIAQSAVTSRSQASTASSRRTRDEDRFADAPEIEAAATSQQRASELDIQPGEDNISWGFRRNQSNIGSQELWESTAVEEDLPDSLLFEPRQNNRVSPESSRSRGSPAPVFASRSATSQHDSKSHANTGVRSGPGSWPALEQSESELLRQELSSSIASSAGPAEEDQFAQPSRVYDTLHPQSERSLSQDGSGEEALAESRLFTHEEAQSMYMSAVTQGSKGSSPVRTFDMPGTWQSDIQDSPQFSNKSPKSSHRVEAEHQTIPSLQPPQNSQTIEENQPESGVETPRAPSPHGLPSKDNAQPEITFKPTCRLLLIDQMAIQIPNDTDSDQADVPAPSSERRPNIDDYPSAPSAQVVRPLARDESTVSTMRLSERDDQLSAKPARRPAITIRSVVVQSDTSTILFLVSAVNSLQAVASAPNKTVHQDPAKKASIDLPALEANIDRLVIALEPDQSLNKVVGTNEEQNSLLELALSNIALSSALDNASLRFNVGVRMRNTQLMKISPLKQPRGADFARLDQHNHGVSINLSRQHDLNHRTITTFDVRTGDIHLDFDVRAIDEAFLEHGGISGLLELSNTTTPGTGVKNIPVKKRGTGGVHFQDDHPTESGDAIKLNASIAGIIADLRGASCAVQAHADSVRAIYREQLSSLSIGEIKIKAPYSADAHEFNEVVTTALRLDFLSTPLDRDLETLLTLLTPSNDKYEDDDDILLDTLLRQRRKGSCLRIRADEVRAIIHKWESLTSLQALSAELTQLAEVTKYLPDDDRPGLLSLVRISNIGAQVPSTPALGDIDFSCQQFQVAHVGLPALLAVAVSNVELSRVKDRTLLIHKLQHLTDKDDLPMVMARILGGEAEPTIKLKMYNICIEYRVQTLLDLLEKPTDTEPRQLIDDMAASIADLALSHAPLPYGVDQSKAPSGSEKQTKVEVLIRHSSAALSPRDAPSKAQLILTDAKISTMMQSETDVNINVVLRRASLFLTDDTAHAADQDFVPPRRIGANAATDTHLANTLIAQGYVSIASITSVKIDVAVYEDDDGEKRIEVDVRNKLVLLETCADSTQTLIATMNGLVPPGKPAKQPKYLTEPIALTEMISSFTGETVEQEEPPNDMLFDIDNAEDDLSDLDMHSALGDDMEVDDLLVECEMTESLYGPVSGLLSDAGQRMSQADEEDRPFTEAAESLLEEDPFVMTVTPADMPFSDTALLKDLRQQAKPVSNSESVEISSLEIEDLGYDALGPHMQVLGQQHRFNAPIAKQQQIKNSPANRSPLKLRLRDLYIIWNIHDGFDWQHTRDDITSAVERVEARAEERYARRRQSRNDLEEEESVIGDCLFNSIYIGVPSNQEAQDIRRQINRHIDDLASETESVPMSGMSRPSTYSASGHPQASRGRRRLKLERSRARKVGFELNGVSADIVVYPEDSSELQSSVDVRVKMFEIYDNVPTSTWKKFLTKLKTNEPEEISRPMMHLELLNVKTLQDYSASELILHVSILPLRLHVDQDALDFITRFFEFKDDSAIRPSDPAEQPFLQRVEIDTVDLQLDYKPKKVDYAGLRSGHTTEFMNFVILDAANIRLKHAIVYGIKGFEPLHKTLNDVWMPDVRRNQLPTVLAGLAPVRSLVNITTGVRDVVAIPVREYKKDGRVFRSVQKGAYHFGKTTASELARLGAKVAIGTHYALQGAEGFLAPTSASSSRPGTSRRVSSDHGWHEIADDEEAREHRAISAYADQPIGVLAGLRSAKRFLEHDLLTAKDALIAVQGEVMTSDGAVGAAAAVAKHAPTVILRPVIGATRAVGTALLGVGNQIDRDNLRRIDDKYKRH